MRADRTNEPFPVRVTNRVDRSFAPPFFRTSQTADTYDPNEQGGKPVQSFWIGHSLFRHPIATCAHRTARHPTRQVTTRFFLGLALHLVQGIRNPRQQQRRVEAVAPTDAPGTGSSGHVGYPFPRWPACSVGLLMPPFFFLPFGCSGLQPT